MYIYTYLIRKSFQIYVMLCIRGVKSYGSALHRSPNPLHSGMLHLVARQRRPHRDLHIRKAPGARDSYQKSLSTSLPTSFKTLNSTQILTRTISYNRYINIDSFNCFKILSISLNSLQRPLPAADLTVDCFRRRLLNLGSSVVLQSLARLHS